MSHKQRAVLDIGSNTIRLLIAQPNSLGGFNTLHYEHHITRLGEGLQQNKQLSSAGKQRAFIAFQSIIQRCQHYGIEPQHIRAVATAAIREASNGALFVAEVERKTHLHIQVISGDEEAHLALQGAQLGLDKEISQNMLLFDVGGASTEFSRIINGEIVDSISLKLGVVRLTEQYLHSDPPSSEDYQRLKQETANLLVTLDTFWQATTALPHHLVGTAGTVTTLAAIAQNMHVYQPSSINGYALTREIFDDLRDTLCRKNNCERLNIPLLEQGREDVMIAGLAIIEVLFERWNYPTLIAVDSGLLEGLLISANHAR